MPLKTMIFMDGSWFYHSRQTLFATAGEDGFEIDYKRMGVLIQNFLAEALDQDVDLVRTCYFGTLPANKPGYNPSKQKVFYNFLSEQCGFETEITQLDFRAEPGSGDDRNIGVSLAVRAMHYAAMPGAYDIAVIIGGSHEYRALSAGLKLFGKRVLLVAIRNQEGNLISSPALLSEPNVSDFPILFLDDHLDELKLVRTEQVRTCKQCGAQEATTWAGPEFFCSKCRDGHRRHVRVCDNCGKEEETTWTKDFFFCSDCRRNHRAMKERGADEGGESAGTDNAEG